MNKLASCFVSVGLAAIALSGCAGVSAATASASDSESKFGASNVMGIGTEQEKDQLLPLAAAAGPADSAEPTDSAGTPADASTPADGEFWERNYAALGTATAAIEEQFPNEFAYAFFDEVPAMHVAFAGPAPTEAVTLLHDTGLPYVIVASVGFNAAEYGAAQDDVFDQIRQYITPERQVSVSSDPSAGPGAIKVSFLSTKPEFTTDPGLTAPLARSRYKPITVDAPFTVTFDDTYTSPIIMGTGTEKVGPSIKEQSALAPGERWWGPSAAETGSGKVDFR
ncbi:hypothetical protein [Cryobacterium sp. TMT4-31]|uniref:hypothetical protein n=1 Tax=Cryobacterium sp. TMT4-31 TaxID=1259259 RepID=UPI00106ADE45|nr:hypothetical protein [Cryobacterium sp. TMT4-31]TFC87412.1 hypothetical protein E3T19_12295 [Cryobacterium sp. TMT4-31]